MEHTLASSCWFFVLSGVSVENKSCTKCQFYLFSCWTGPCCSRFAVHEWFQFCGCTYVFWAVCHIWTISNRTCFLGLGRKHSCTSTVSTQNLIAKIISEEAVWVNRTFHDYALNMSKSFCTLIRKTVKTCTVATFVVACMIFVSV